MDMKLLANCCAYQNGYKTKLLLCEVNYLFRLVEFCFDRVENDNDLLAAIKIIKRYFRLLGTKNKFKYKRQYLATIYSGLTHLPNPQPGNNYADGGRLVKLTNAELTLIKKKCVRIITPKQAQEKLKQYFLYVPQVCQSLETSTNG